MKRAAMVSFIIFLGLFFVWPAIAAGPSGSTECHVSDDDCDGRIDEDPVDGVDNDGDGRVDEDPPGNTSAHPNKNQADCNESSSQNVGGVFYLYAGSNGAETCADGTSGLPVDGRVIVTSDQGGYVSADGDADNSAPANGYLRVDGGGFHCGDDNNQDSTAGQSGNTPEDCG